ncbi:MAG TPA: DUF2577 family protein [Pseudoneobacillus sp.]|nr:DUF2577 family protein [Pseudoneobacillus sp.]
MAKEGSSYSNLLNLIKDHGYNKDNHTVIGKVISANPLKIQMDGFILEQGDFYIAERLTRHKRIVTINHYENTERDLGDKKEKDYVTSSGMGIQSDDRKGPLNGDTSPYVDTTLVLNFVEIQYEDVLKVGDFVVILIDNNDFFIIDRVVS